MNINDTYARIGNYINAHSSQTYGEIGSTLGLSRHQVSRIARLRGIKRRPGNRASLEAAIAAIEAVSPKPGSVSTGGVAPAPEETVSTAPDAPSVEAAQATTPDTPPTEIPVA